MTTRNPMNQRYTQDDGIKGQSRKSAASAKPKAKAAYSVTVKEKPVTPEEKRKAQRAREKAQRKEVNQRMAAMGTPTDPAYKKWRRVWVALLVLAIVAIALSWLVRMGSSFVFSYTMLFLSYAAIIAALIVDIKMIRPFRLAQQREAEKPISKNQKKKLDKQAAVVDAAVKAEEARKRAEKYAEREKTWYGKIANRIAGPAPKTATAEAEDAEAAAKAAADEAQAEATAASTEAAESAETPAWKPRKANTRQKQAAEAVRQQIAEEKAAAASAEDEADTTTDATDEAKDAGGNRD